MIEKPFEGKRILVTGGTGSLGKPLVRRILGGTLGRPESVTVFSRDEGKHHQMKAAWINERAATDDIFYHNFEELLEFRLGDMRDYSALVPAVRNAEIIFHAAALKQVPSCEYFPYEAVRTNVDGANNLVRAIRSNDTPVEFVVGISTDKACKPVNVMGMTKSIQERVLLEGNIGQDEADFVCVRYGNVVSSRGSVIPLFRQQIAAGGPVTLTDPDMTRFIMTLPEAVALVTEALFLARGGEVFVTKMRVCRIEDLAVVMIEELAPRYGHDPEDVRIRIVGPRPGEKLYEELTNEEEIRRTIELENHLVIVPALRPCHRRIDYSYPLMRNRRPGCAYNSSAIEPMSREELRAYLRVNNFLDG